MLTRSLVPALALLGSVTAAQAQPSNWLASLTGGHTLDKFAVMADLTVISGQGPQDPFANKKQDTVYLQCDFSVALECTNAPVTDGGPTVWIIRAKSKDAAQPYTIRVQPRLWAERFDFGPFNADQLKNGAKIHHERERVNPQTKRKVVSGTITGQLQIVEGKKAD
jgi:hypothetical protein